MEDSYAGLVEGWDGELTWGQVRDLRNARETIRRFDPARAMLLDVLHPVPPCPHKPVQQRTDYGQRPRWNCRGCGIELAASSRGRWFPAAERDALITKLGKQLKGVQ